MQKRNGKNKARVLIVDDEFHVARGAAMVLSQAGYECETCPTVEAAMKVLEHKGADVIVADMRMPGMDGMDLLKKVQVKDPDVAVVLSVPLPAAESAKEALRGGAFDCVTKPFDNDELNAVVDRAVEMSALQRENRKLREQLDVASIAAGFYRRGAQKPPARCDDSTGRPVAHHGADRGRDRHRQGAGGADAALLEQSRRRPVRRHQLQGAGRRRGRERAVRP